jgi:branched-chain amino acid aminotransferase
MLGEIRRTAAAFRAGGGGSGELYIRLQVTRGGGPIGLDPAFADQSDYVILVQPCPVLAPAQAAGGIRLAVATGLRRNPAAALDPAWKTGNYLNNLLGLREARGRGADEVLLLNLAGEVAEAAVANVAFVRGGALVTPPLSTGILGGITRQLVLAHIAAAAGVTAHEQSIRPADLPGMDECLLLSTTKDIVPVAAVDEARFRVGPQSVTARLKAAFADYARTYAQAHPEGRLG